jgi:anti-anti-sigma regulatory factor
MAPWAARPGHWPHAEAIVPAEPRTPSLTIEAGFHHHTAKVSIWGALDPASAPLLAEMLSLVLDRQPRDLVLDLAGVTACDRVAASVITHAADTLPPLCRLVIERPGPDMRRLLQQCGQDRGAA